MFHSEPVKSFIEFYLTEVNKLEHDHEPPYAKIHAKIGDALKALGHSPASADHFHLFTPGKKSVAKAPPVETNGVETADERSRVGGRKRQAKAAKAEPSEDGESEAEEEREKPKSKRTPAARKNGAKDSDHEAEADKPSLSRRA